MGRTAQGDFSGNSRFNGDESLWENLLALFRDITTILPSFSVFPSFSILPPPHRHNSQHQLS